MERGQLVGGVLVHIEHPRQQLHHRRQLRSAELLVLQAGLVELGREPELRPRQPVYQGLAQP